MKVGLQLGPRAWGNTGWCVLRTLRFMPLFINLIFAYYHYLSLLIVNSYQWCSHDEPNGCTVSYQALQLTGTKQVSLVLSGRVDPSR